MALLSSYLVDYIEQNIPVFSSADGVNTTACTAVLAGTVAGLVIGVLLLRMRASYRTYDPDEHGEEWQGMKKTLLLFAGFVLLFPVVEVVRLVEEKYLFSAFVWNALAGNGALYSSWWGGTLVFSSVMRGLAFVLAGTVVVLLVLRRRSIRWAVLLYIATEIAAGAVQNFLYAQIFVEDGEAIRQQHFDRVAGLLTLLLLVVPYMWVSRRVHATFRN